MAKALNLFQSPYEQRKEMSHRQYRSLNVSLKLYHIFIQTAKLILLIFSKKLLRTQSTWDPEDRNISKSFREQFESLQKKVAKVKTKQKKGYNLTSKESKALKSLQRNKKNCNQTSG